MVTSEIIRFSHNLIPYRFFLLVLFHLLMFAVVVLVALSAESAQAAEPDCSNRLRTAASVSFDSQKIGRQNLLYQSVYTEHNWAGDLMAVCVNARGDISACQCENQSGKLDQCAEPFTVGFPEIKWSADTIAWEIDRGLNKNPDDGWWQRRQVITYSDQAMDGVAFDYLSISDHQRKWLRYDPDLLAFIRGDRSLEGVRFRKRSSYYGDFRNSTPVNYSSIVLAGANDGMLHVFDEQTGHEFFSYLPNLLFSTWVEETATSGSREEYLALLADNDYQGNHRYYVDAPVVINYLEDRSTTLAVGSLGRGGRGIYALNLFGLREMANIEERADQIVMWEYPNPVVDGLQAREDQFDQIEPEIDESADSYSDTITALSTDPYLGRVFGTPQIVKLPYPDNDGFRWSVVFGNGYHSLNQTPVLYVLDAYDGSVIRRILTTKLEDSDNSSHGNDCNEEFGCDGLSSPTLVDDDEDGIIDYGYAGDLAGNLWKFDFTPGDIYGADGYIASFYDPGDLDIEGRPAPRPLITVRDKQGNPQPIISQPTVTRSCTSKNDGLMVLFGTGWLDPANDPGSDIQSVYGIWDWQSFWRNNPAYGIDPMSAFYGELEKAAADGPRNLSNVSSLIVEAGAERLGLLEQTQQSFVGMNYSSEQDPQVMTGLALEGEVKEIVDEPGDFTAYDQVVRTLSNHRINWFHPEHLTDGSSGPAHLGWFFDLPFGDEQVASDPLVLDGILYYSTSLWTDSVCGIDGSNRMLMAHDSCSGGGADTIVFDLNGDEMLSSSDSVAIYDPDGSVQGALERAAGVVNTNTIAAPTMIAGKNQDLLYVSRYVSDESGIAEDNIIEPGLQPELVKSSIRGRNLGMTFWRELY